MPSLYPQPDLGNTLFYGDNLKVLQQHIRDDSIDLIYLDPPFNSQADYNVLFKDAGGGRSAAQLQAFKDTWSWKEAALTFEDLTLESSAMGDALRAFGQMLPRAGTLAYLTMMAPRLRDLRRVLKPTGSIYLHCDPTASHYLRVLMDAIFGPEQFQNEIIWRRTAAHGARRSFGPIHDTILFYTKTNEHFFRIVKRPYMKGHVEKRYKQDASGQFRFSSGGNILTGSGATGGESGQPWRGFDPSAKNRHWAIPGFLAEQMPPEFKKLGVLAKLDALYEAGLIEITEGNAWPVPVRYLSDADGQPIQDIWAYQPYTEGTVAGTPKGIDEDVAWFGTTDPERLGYQTQKPVGLLERIIRSSCPDEGIVLDPFCGCGTTIVASQKLGRAWLGIDITQAAIQTIKKRLATTFGPSATFNVIGEPVSIPDAERLAADDPYQFQWWALGLVGARPADQKKGADKGIDGRLFFRIRPGEPPHQFILSVKAGQRHISHVRELHSVITRENAEIGVLLCMQEPSGPMVSEAASAGFYQSPWGKHPRLQIITVAELLSGKKIDAPALEHANVTFKQAQRVQQPVGEQLGFEVDE